MGHEVDVPMEIPAGVDDVSAGVYDPDGKLERSTFRRDPDGLFHLKFVPTKAGQHKVSGDSDAGLIKRLCCYSFINRSYWTHRSNWFWSWKQ